MTTDHDNAKARFDVTSVGEAMLRLSVPAGRRLSDASSFGVEVGGAESNVCAALACLGRQVGWVSHVPRNHLGDLVLRTMREANVNVDAVRHVEDARQGLYFVEFGAAPRATQVTYDRANSAAAGMTSETIDWSYLLDTRLIHLTGITPALSRGCADLVQEVIERASAAGVRVSFDVNYRSRLWPASEARSMLHPLVLGADIAFCGIADATSVFGYEGSPHEVLEALGADREGKPTILTLASHGAIALADGEVFEADPVDAKVLDKLGAGDALAAGVIDGWLDGSLEVGLKRGVALASLAVAQEGDMLITDREELQSVLGGERFRVIR